MNSTCELGDDAARVLKPYQDYKTSGVQWLGKVPAHWEVAPVKQKYAIRLGKMLQPARRASDDCRISYLKAKHVQWFEVRTNDIDTMWATPDEVDRYGIVAGDLLVCEGGEGGRCGIVKHGTALPDPCIIQNALHRVRPRSWGSVGDISRNDYLQYMMSTVASTGWFDVLTDKATIAHFTAKKFGALLASIPPLPEQAAIVRFLDHADRRIRRYIRAKQKLITLLEEQKQAIIHQAVTGQIDVRTGKPYRAYKDSRVEWLGEVPETWDVVALRHRYSQCLGKMLDSKRITGDHSVPYLRNVDIQWDQINVDNLPVMDISPDEHERFTVKRDDLLVCEGGEVGRCALWSDELTKCGFQKALHRLRPRNTGQDDVPRFMYYVLRAAARSGAFDDGHLSTIAHLTGDKLRAHRLPFPTVEEQDSIVGFLDDRLRGLTGHAYTRSAKSSA